MKSRVSLVFLLLAGACTGEPARPPGAPAYGPEATAPARSPERDAPGPGYGAEFDAPAQPAIAAPQLPPEAGVATGPSGTAGAGTPSAYDAVGYASWYGDEAAGQPTASGAPFAPDAITAAHRTLPLGSIAEVTALDTGRTILVQVTDRGPGRADREIDLSRGAAQALGIGGRPVAPVRVRSVVAGPADIAALRTGQAASPRLDTPDVVLRALRRRLPKAPVGAAATPRPVRPGAGTGYAPPAAAPRYTPTAPLDATRFMVQVAAFSGEARARNLARTLGGHVEGGGGLWRVRLGPFADMPSAQRARDAAAARGYGDAAILVAP